MRVKGDLYELRRGDGGEFEAGRDVELDGQIVRHARLDRLAVNERAGAILLDLGKSFGAAGERDVHLLGRERGLDGLARLDHGCDRDILQLHGLAFFHDQHLHLDVGRLDLGRPRVVGRHNAAAFREGLHPAIHVQRLSEQPFDFAEMACRAL